MKILCRAGMLCLTRTVVELKPRLTRRRQAIACYKHATRCCDRACHLKFQPSLYSQQLPSRRYNNPLVGLTLHRRLPVTYQTRDLDAAIKRQTQSQFQISHMLFGLLQSCFMEWLTLFYAVPSCKPLLTLFARGLFEWGWSCVDFLVCEHKYEVGTIKTRTSCV